MKPATFTKARKSARGADGLNGLDGINGENGLDGINGESGLDGKDGLNGSEGKDGRDGLAGINGHNGIDGKDGQDGDRGFQGDQGDTGLQGEAGPQGIPGDKGEKGDNGDTGPTPDHQIDRKKGRIRFVRNDGTWGAWVEIKAEVIDRTVTNVMDSGGRGEQSAALLKAWYDGQIGAWVIEDGVIQPKDPTNDVKVDALGGIADAITTVDADGKFQATEATLTDGQVGGSFLNLTEWAYEPVNTIEGDTWIVDDPSTGGKLLKYFDGTSKFSVELSQE